MYLNQLSNTFGTLIEVSPNMHSERILQVSNNSDLLFHFWGTRVSGCFPVTFYVFNDWFLFSVVHIIKSAFCAKHLFEKPIQSTFGSMRVSPRPKATTVFRTRTKLELQTRFNSSFEIVHDFIPDL